MTKEYLDRHIKPLINPALLEGDLHNSDRPCKECGVPLKDSDATVCYDCYCENFRKGN